MPARKYDSYCKDRRAPARFRVPEFGNLAERERPARLALRSIAGRWRAGKPRPYE